MMHVEVEPEDFLFKCHHNLAALENNLIDIGYRFARTDGPFRVAVEVDQDVVRETEVTLGALPLLVRRWYERFQYVDFSQEAEQLCDRSSPLRGLGYNLPLVFRELNSCFRLRDELSASGVKVNRPELEKRLLPFGSFATNCEPKGVWLPDDCLDPVIYDEGGGPVRLSQELRTVFQTGGFPFWDRLFRKRMFTSPLGFAPEFPELSQVLRRNLVDV
jgi:hypothetical protein